MGGWGGSGAQGQRWSGRGGGPPGRPVGAAVIHPCDEQPSPFPPSETPPPPLPRRTRTYIRSPAPSPYLSHPCNPRSCSALQPHASKPPNPASQKTLHPPTPALPRRRSPTGRPALPPPLPQCPPPTPILNTPLPPPVPHLGLDAVQRPELRLQLALEQHKALARRVQLAPPRVQVLPRAAVLRRLLRQLRGRLGQGGLEQLDLEVEQRRGRGSGGFEEGSDGF